MTVAELMKLLDGAPPGAGVALKIGDTLVPLKSITVDQESFTVVSWFRPGDARQVPGLATIILA